MRIHVVLPGIGFVAMSLVLAVCGWFVGRWIGDISIATAKEAGAFVLARDAIWAKYKCPVAGAVLGLSSPVIVMCALDRLRGGK